MRRLLASILLVTLLGCNGYRVHPGSPDRVSSVSYDALLVADSIIIDGRSALTKGTLPEAARAPLNALIDSYNLARLSLKTYSDAVTQGKPSQQYLDDLNRDIAAVNAKITSFKKVK